MDQVQIWEMKPNPGVQINEYASELNISKLLARLLLQRGISSLTDARKFLWGGLEELTSPWSLGGMAEAVHRIEQARAQTEKIVVYGDYDVDGVSSVAILLKCLQELGCQAQYFIPDRFQEGYGLNSAAISELAQQGCQLLISVDCGINSLEEIELAGQLGLDVIITDHHNPGPQLPTAVAIINPKLDNNEDSRELAGAGVAFQLARALGETHLPPASYKEWLALAALATVADVVPLRGDNRILVKEGLKTMRENCPLGIMALLQESSLQAQDLEAWHLAFVLAPRLNAAGRLENACLSAELLLSRDSERAREIAQYLCRLNEERKALEKVILDEAGAMIEKQDENQTPAIVLAADNWHHGVLGITASRLCERYRKPVLMVSWEDDEGRGSARSLIGYNIFEALSNSRDTLIRFGGHSLAAGFKVARDQYNQLRDSLLSWAQGIKKANPEWGYKRMLLDGQIEQEDINSELIRELGLLKPYGEGNPEPLFVIRGTELESPSLMGRGREHFKARLSGQEVECIAFNRTDYMGFLHQQMLIDLAGNLKENTFRGRKSIQFKMLDAKASIKPDHCKAAPADNHEILLVQIAGQLEQKQSLVIVFPTIRVLQRGKIWLEGFFPSSLLFELHGGVVAEERSSIFNLLTKGEVRILLSTRTFMQNIDVWRTGEPIPAIQWPKIDAKLTWQEASLELNDKQRCLVYVNRPSTVTHLRSLYPGLILEASLSDSRMRRRAHREFFNQARGIMLSDGGCIRGLRSDWDAQHIVFADAPFSIYEASLVTEHLEAGREPYAGICFSSQGLEANRQYLDLLYPESYVVRRVWEGLLGGAPHILKGEDIQISKNLSKNIGRPLSVIELGSCLRILEDLDLCRVRKKGSIIAIKLIKRDVLPDNLSNSAFFLEGLAEKTALASFENEVKTALDW